jgi:DNA polymerase III epsilon subunit-like protein
VFDTETTGLTAADELMEIGAVELIDGCLTEVRPYLTLACFAKRAALTWTGRGRFTRLFAPRVNRRPLLCMFTG